MCCVLSQDLNTRLPLAHLTPVPSGRPPCYTVISASATVAKQPPTWHHLHTFLHKHMHTHQRRRQQQQRRLRLTGINREIREPRWPKCPN